ncbi:hypothetical protein BDZ94DRAFT_739533 [Collybia nuda]|uniref:Uncharacterized protein n=1 Tax=Collybia nuda TaxID=64659 RepID=A0A9P6CBU2_9AGAR|nr:hypothetical protein BDZ94DRAFT_739533 [Collybia nuda]
MHSPPDWTGNSREKSLAWVANQYSSSFQTIQEIMESALNAFNARYSSIHESEHHPKINAEICLDMVSMQHQLPIMTEYRRYVIIRGFNETPPSYAPGLEWITAQDFDFRDEFII